MIFYTDRLFAPSLATPGYIYQVSLILVQPASTNTLKVLSNSATQTTTFVTFLFSICYSVFFLVIKEQTGQYQIILVQATSKLVKESFQRPPNDNCRQSTTGYQVACFTSTWAIRIIRKSKHTNPLAAVVNDQVIERPCRCGNVPAQSSTAMTVISLVSAS